MIKINKEDVESIYLANINDCKRYRHKFQVKTKILFYHL